MIRTAADFALKPLLDAMLFGPSREIVSTPAEFGAEFRDLELETDDGERLHGWLIGDRQPPLGHLILCHGNGGNIGDRAMNAGALSDAGFEVLLFDYRGYGRSSGRPDEAGTYRDVRAAREGLLAQKGVDRARVFYLGESLGGAIALELALEFPPKGLILQSTFTSVRDVARRHYPLIPTALVPDAYPSSRRIPLLDAPLLVLHGDRDSMVPVSHARALHQAARVRKQLRVFEGCAHDDLVARGVDEYARVIAEWARGLDP